MVPFVSRPSVLRAIDAPKPWGWELWLNATRPEGAAGIAGGDATLAAQVEAHPEALGRWTARLFGEGLPIFTKLIHTGFPPRVHLGFRRAVGRTALEGWLDHEQACLRRLFTALRPRDARGFKEFQARYEAWATRQALDAWRRDDDGVTAEELAPFVDATLELRPFLHEVRENRAAIVDTLNEIDLSREAGNLFLSSAGVVHAIFGLSHQTHPLDRSRATLEALFAAFADQVAKGADDAALDRTLHEAGALAGEREKNRAPPKNEAWLGTTIDGEAILVEPQQSSDTTYSIADFYTPFTWAGDHARFRKGDAASGLARATIAGYLDEIRFAPTSVDAMRRTPHPVAGGRGVGWELSRLVDEPAAWPFFTAYQVDLEGSLRASPPPGVFQQIVVTRGRVALRDGHGPLGELTPRAPAFVPATMEGSYELTAREPSTVMLFAVPGARGGAPRLAG